MFFLFGEFKLLCRHCALPASKSAYPTMLLLFFDKRLETAVTPQLAVAKLADIVAERREFSEDEIYSAMSSAGLPNEIADRAFKFTQTAWGRAFLARLGVRFSPEYLCFNSAGEVIETGQLEGEPHYAAAMYLVPRYSSSAGFQRLALMSADVHAVNELLNKGSKAKDLVTSPAFLFLEAPTESGMVKARQVIAKHMTKLQKENPLRKPWWRFW